MYLLQYTSASISFNHILAFPSAGIPFFSGVFASAYNSRMILKGKVKFPRRLTHNFLQNKRNQTMSTSSAPLKRSDTTPTMVKSIGNIGSDSDRDTRKLTKPHRRHSATNIDSSALSKTEVKSILKKTSSYARIGDAQSKPRDEMPRRLRRRRTSKKKQSPEKTPPTYRRKVSFNSMSMVTAERWTHQGSLSTGNLNSLVMPSRPHRRPSNDGDNSPQPVKSSSVKNLEGLLSTYSTSNKELGTDGPGQGNFVWRTTGENVIPVNSKGSGRVVTKAPMSEKDTETLRKLLNSVSIRKPSRRTSMDHEDPAFIGRSCPENVMNVFQAKTTDFVQEKGALPVSNSLVSMSA